MSGMLSQARIQRIILAVLVVVVYGISLSNGFVWDDAFFFIGKPVYRDFKLHDIFFSLANGVEYLPLRDITYAIDYQVWGENPLGFHLTNLVFFSGNVLLVHYLAELIIKRISAVSDKPVSRFVPFAVAAGFAIHPINAEAVNFITCRNVLVSGFFFFLAFICFVRSHEDTAGFSFKWYLAAILAFVGAMLGKATAIMLPLLLMVTLPMLFPGRIKRLLLSIAPFFLIAAGFFLAFRTIAIEAGITGAARLERTVSLVLQIPFFYLKKLLIPYGFSVYTSELVASLLSVQVILSLVALVVIVVSATLLRQRFPIFVFGICWFFIALLPVLNFFATNPVVADRYAYLPTFGFMLAAASAIDKVRSLKIKILVCLAIGILLSGVAITRSLDWHSSETLWKANIRNFPGSTKGYVNLAEFYFSNGQQQKAVDLLVANSGVPWLNVYLDLFEGRRLLEQNDLAAAKKRFLKAENIVNGNVSILQYLGIVAEREKDYVAAAQYYNRALTSDEPDNFKRPVIRERLKELKTTWLDHYLSDMKQRLEKNPKDLTSRKELALILDRLCFYNEALENYLELVKGGVTGWQIYHNIANCYFNLNKYGDAVRYYEMAVALGGDLEDTFNNLGISYKKLAKYDKSIQVLLSASRKFPAAPYPEFNLAVTYFDSGQKEKARTSFAEVDRKHPEFKDRTAPYILELSSPTR